MNCKHTAYCTNCKEYCITCGCKCNDGIKISFHAFERAQDRLKWDMSMLAGMTKRAYLSGKTIDDSDLTSEVRLNLMLALFNKGTDYRAEDARVDAKIL